MKQALSEFQQQHGLKQTGMLDQETLAAFNNKQNGAASSLSGSTTQLPSTFVEHGEPLYHPDQIAVEANSSSPY